MNQDKTQLEERLSQAIRTVGSLKNFGGIFSGTYEMILREQDVPVVSPKEFFRTAAEELETTTDTLKKLQREFLIQQGNLFLKFYRDNMSAFWISSYRQDNR